MREGRPVFSLTIYSSNGQITVSVHTQQSWLGSVGEAEIANKISDGIRTPDFLTVQNANHYTIKHLKYSKRFKLQLVNKRETIFVEALNAAFISIKNVENV